LNVSAYVLLGDPAFLVPSIRSYYDDVTSIVASYDQDLLSWGGADMGPEMRACIRLIEANDPDGKVELLPGPFSCPELHPQDGETNQRQVSLDRASELGEWVIQLDTDEVVGNAARLLHEIDAADHLGLDALEYPSRWIYCHLFDCWFLERSTRRLKTWDAIPGPLVVRAGTRLRYARQTDAPTHKLRIGSGQGGGTVPIEDCVLHFSMVRTGAAMQAKAATSPHAPDLDWNARLGLWEQARRQPVRAVARSVLSPTFGTYRPARLPAHFDADLVARETMAGDPDLLRSLEAERP
jgi:hypothetical protein